MMERFGASPDLALGYALLLRVALWLPITVLGAIYFFREGFSVSTDLSALQSQYRAEEASQSFENKNIDEEHQ